MERIKWEAIYMPATSKTDPSKGGFNSSEEAWEYASCKTMEMVRRKYRPD